MQGPVCKNIRKTGWRCELFCNNIGIHKAGKGVSMILENVPKIFKH